ncbi:hypothetical protein EU527_08680 [Candidatus Thorarchaeota archaeon]|nr:MAG: hypothetical protein EU527_08680 [Candidatus Thorarchaeota archaeon]
MEYSVGLLITGSFIFIITLYRLRKVRQHHKLEELIQGRYDVSDLDLSGSTQYTDCYSHNWVIDNITKRTHSRIGAMFQDHLANNTLLAGIWIGFIVSISSMLLALLFLESLRSIGTVIIIFLAGVLIALGPGGPRYAENLLDAIMQSNIEELNTHDYVYVKIANDTIKRSVIVNVIFASAFLLISPWGDLLPILLSQGIAYFTVNIILEPAFLLLNFNIAFALFYIVSIIGVSSIVCFKIGQRLISHEEEGPIVHY